MRLRFSRQVNGNSQHHTAETLPSWPMTAVPTELRKEIRATATALASPQMGDVGAEWEGPPIREVRREKHAERGESSRRLSALHRLTRREHRETSTECGERSERGLNKPLCKETRLERGNSEHEGDTRDMRRDELRRDLGTFMRKDGRCGWAGKAERLGSSLPSLSSPSSTWLSSNQGGSQRDNRCGIILSPAIGLSSLESSMEERAGAHCMPPGPAKACKRKISRCAARSVRNSKESPPLLSVTTFTQARALIPKRNVETVSATCREEMEQLMSNAVCEFPPKESCNTRVSLELR